MSRLPGRGACNTELLVWLAQIQLNCSEMSQAPEFLIDLTFPVYVQAQLADDY